MVYDERRHIVLVLIACVISVLVALGVCWGVGGFASWHWLWQLPLTWVGSMAVCIVLVFAFLWICTKTVNLEEPQEEDSPFFRKLITLSAKNALILMHVKLHVTGLEKLPKDRRFMLVCNHLYLFDPLVLLAVMPQAQLAFIAKKEVANMPIVAQLLHRTMGQFIDRENDRAAIITIRSCIDLVKEDKASVAVFPEGYTSRDGKLQPFRNGVFKIAQRGKVPVVVCTLRNTQKMLNNLFSPKAKHVYLNVLDVLEPESFQGSTTADIGDRAHALMKTVVD